MQIMLKTPKLVFGLILASTCLQLFAADIDAGKQKSMICASCHGSKGISNSPLWPNLAGQKEAYIEKQMKAFRDGERKDPMMTAMAKPLSDEDIKNLAAYYASL